MTINQLFKEQPPTELVYRYCHLFGLSGVSDKKWFSKSDMMQHDTLCKIRTTLFDDLKKLYIDCKAKSYLTDMNEKSAITILRQLAKTLGYTVERRVVTTCNRRHTEYQLSKAIAT